MFTIVAPPFRNPAADAIGQRDSSGFDGLHRKRRRRKDFCERREVKDRIGLGRRRVGLVTQPAERLAPEQAFRISHLDDRRGVSAIEMALQHDIGGGLEGEGHYSGKGHYLKDSRPTFGRYSASPFAPATRLS